MAGVFVGTRSQGKHRRRKPCQGKHCQGKLCRGKRFFGKRHRGRTAIADGRKFTVDVAPRGWATYTAYVLRPAPEIVRDGGLALACGSHSRSACASLTQGRLSAVARWLGKAGSGMAPRDRRPTRQDDCRPGSRGHLMIRYESASGASAADTRAAAAKRMDPIPSFHDGQCHSAIAARGGV